MSILNTLTFNFKKLEDQEFTPPTPTTLAKHYCLANIKRHEIQTLSDMEKAINYRLRLFENSGNSFNHKSAFNQVVIDLMHQHILK